MASAEILALHSSLSTCSTHEVYDMSSSQLPSPHQVNEKNVMTLQTGLIPNPGAKTRRASSFDKNSMLAEGHSTIKFTSSNAIYSNDVQVGAKAETLRRPRTKTRHYNRMTNIKKISSNNQITDALDGLVGFNLKSADTSCKAGVKTAELGSRINGLPTKKAVRKSRSSNLQDESRNNLFGSGHPHTTFKDNRKRTKVNKTAPSPKEQDLSTGETQTKDKINRYGLAIALKRRTDWTPPPSENTKVTEAISDDSTEKDASHFGKFLENFVFSNKGANSVEKNTTAGAGTRKRKLINLVNTQASASVIARAPKRNGIKKKRRTITDVAISAFADTEKVHPGSTLSLQCLFTKDGLETTTDGFNLAPKSPRGPDAFSPESVVRQSAKQDFIFGSLSQLASDESPVLSRNLHKDITICNEYYDPLEDRFSTQVTNSSSSTLGQRKSTGLAKRNLWAAASRDNEGNLVEIATVRI